MTTEPVTQSEDLFTTANRCLLMPHEIDTAALQTVFGQMLSHHIDYADLYFQYSRAEGWALEEGIVKSGSFNIDQGVGVRAVSGDKTAFAYSDDISMPALASAAQATRAIARHGVTQSVQAVKRSKGRELYLPQDPIGSLNDKEKVALLEKLEGYARAIDKRVIQVMASLAGEYEVVLVARGDGTCWRRRMPARTTFGRKSLPRKMVSANKVQREEEDALTMLISQMIYCGITPPKQCTRLSSIWTQNPRLPVP